MDSTSPNQLAFNIWKHSNWLRPERNVKFLLNLCSKICSRICSKDEDFKTKSDEYVSYLIKCGHDKEHVLEKFNEVSNLRRDEARTRRINSGGNHCVLSVKYNPRGPSIRQIIKKHRSIIENDERAKEILPTNFIRVSYKRNANLKELLAPSNPYKERVVNESIGCFKCAAKWCDCCRNFLGVGTSFSSIKTKKIYKISKSLSCTSANVVYLAICVACHLQGVGSTTNFKKRVANYKSHIKRQRRTCSIVNHFLDCHNADHSTLKFMLIDQRDDDLREGENFWIGMLLTNQGGLNSHHDFVQQ